MACFLAPATAAIITTSISKKIPAKYHLEWLNTMLWGGVVMLIAEHIINGEIIMYPPFLTAIQNPANTPKVIQEIITVGGTMTVAVFFVWIAMVLAVNISPRLLKKKENGIIS